MGSILSWLRQEWWDAIEIQSESKRQKAMNVPDLRSCTPEGWSVLHEAVQRNNEAVVRWLVDVERVGIDLRAKSDFTPLHVAADELWVEGAEKLLNAGANPQAATTDNKLPVDIADIKIAAQSHLFDDYKKSKFKQSDVYRRLQEAKRELTDE